LAQGFLKNIFDAKFSPGQSELITFREISCSSAPSSGPIKIEFTQLAIFIFSLARWRCSRTSDWPIRNKNVNTIINFQNQTHKSVLNSVSVILKIGKKSRNDVINLKFSKIFDKKFSGKLEFSQNWNQKMDHFEQKMSQLEKRALESIESEEMEKCVIVRVYYCMSRFLPCK
jgi:hypothetical protein